MQIIITSPSVAATRNISGISAITNFIISQNPRHRYTHFVLGRQDGQARNLAWFTSLLVTYLKWLRLIATSRDHIIHFNLAMETPSVVRDAPLILAARLLRRRLIVHLHGGVFLTARPMPRWMKRVVGLALGSGPVIVMSEVERIRVESEFPAARVFPLPNCVDTSDAKGHQPSCSTDGPLRVLFLGRIALTKGIDVAYEALATLRTEGIRVRLILAGTGPVEQTYVARFRALLGDDFEFKGVISGDEKLAVLRNCDVFLLPSLYEGLPMALLETMAYGMVPVTTPVGSIPTIVVDGFTGLVVDPSSPGHIVKALSILDRDRDYLRHLAMNSRRYVLEHCMPEQYITHLNGIYQHA